jgi:polyribonucleotide nucleotidyltransferase
LRAELMKALKESEAGLAEPHSLLIGMAVDHVLHEAFRGAILGAATHTHNHTHSDSIDNSITDSSSTDSSTVSEISSSSSSANRRSDGRTHDQLREVRCAANVLPVVHGSAYFARGDTHSLCTVTLGPKSAVCRCRCKSRSRSRSRSSEAVVCL